MTDKITAKGPWWVMSAYIRNRESFKTNGALRGEEVTNANEPTYTGQLPDEWVLILSAEIDDVDYVVYSYSTPIAWHSGAHGWTVPKVKYSVTTSAHQAKIRTCLEGLSELAILAEEVGMERDSIEEIVAAAREILSYGEEGRRPEAEWARDVINLVDHS